jgi:hypothetical protein
VIGCQFLMWLSLLLGIDPCMTRFYPCMTTFLICMTGFDPCMMTFLICMTRFDLCMTTFLIYLPGLIPVYWFLMLFIDPEGLSLILRFYMVI